MLAAATQVTKETAGHQTKLLRSRIYGPLLGIAGVVAWCAAVASGAKDSGLLGMDPPIQVTVTAPPQLQPTIEASVKSEEFRLPESVKHLIAKRDAKNEPSDKSNALIVYSVSESLAVVSIRNTSNLRAKDVDLLWDADYVNVVVERANGSFTETSFSKRLKLGNLDKQEPLKLYVWSYIPENARVAWEGGSTNVTVMQPDSMPIPKPSTNTAPAETKGNYLTISLFCIAAFLTGGFATYWFQGARISRRSSTRPVAAIATQ